MNSSNWLISIFNIKFLLLGAALLVGLFVLKGTVMWAQEDKNGLPVVKGEAPLPEGWPKPTRLDKVEIKEYPAMRMATASTGNRQNSQFMTLFNHIKEKDIPMTAPVIMNYDAKVVDKPNKMDQPESMAFLYRNTREGKLGQDKSVMVEDAETMTVVSIGLRGSYTAKNYRGALEKLGKWLDKNDQWEVNGPPRVLGYNSPFVPWWQKYSEVQIPVKETGEIAQNNKAD